MAGSKVTVRVEVFHQQRLLAQRVLGLVLGAILLGAPANVWSQTAATAPAVKAELPNQLVLASGAGSQIDIDQKRSQGILARELFRQAFIIAAAETNNVAAYDLNLGQRGPEGCPQVDLKLLANPGLVFQLSVVQGTPGMQGKTEHLRPHAADSFSNRVEEAEQFSRGLFGVMLEKVARRGSPTFYRNPRELLPQVPPLLADMNFVSQWHAAALLHEDIEKRGYTVHNLAALSRAYSNLGILTDRHFHPTNKVFRARALLYAQRMVRDGRAKGLAHETRAYAYMLLGMPLLALEDLLAIEGLKEEERQGMVGLAPLMKSYLDFDYLALEPDRHPDSLRQLATLLSYLAREYSYDDNAKAIAAMKVMESMPQCYRVVAEISENRELGTARQATGVSPLLTGATLYSRIAKLPSLPPAIKKLADEGLVLTTGGGPLGSHDVRAELVLRGKLIGALQAADGAVGEQQRLTFPTLAFLLSDHSFMEVVRLAEVLTHKLSVPLDPGFEVFEPIYKPHPYGYVVDSYRGSLESRQVAIGKAKQESCANLDMNARALLPVIDGAQAAMVGQWSQTRDKLARQTDMTGADLSRLFSRLPQAPGARPDQLAEAFYETWPNSTLARQAMINHNWRAVKLDLDVWINRTAQEPLLTPALAQRLIAEREFEKAAQMLEQSVKLAGSFEAYFQLATCYQRMDKKLDAIEAFKGALQLPDRGLSRAKFNEYIAREYLKLDRAQDALPYAEAAADSYSEWGLRVAGETHEILRSWADAEKYFKAASLRYGTTDWYRFTHGTPFGDYEGAREFMRKAALDDRNGRLGVTTRVHLLLLSDKPEVAADYLRRQVQQNPRATTLRLLLASACDQKGDAKAHEAALRELLADDAAQKSNLNHPAWDICHIKLAEAILADGEKGSRGELDPEAIDAASERAESDDGRIDLYYLAGRYCELREKKDLAKAFYLKAWGTDYVNYNTRYAAGERLERMGVDARSILTESQKKLYGDAVASSTDAVPAAEPEAEKMPAGEKPEAPKPEAQKPEEQKPEEQKPAAEQPAP